MFSGFITPKVVIVIALVLIFFLFLMTSLNLFLSDPDAVEPVSGEDLDLTDDIYLNSPSDRFHNIAVNDHPILQVWWELTNMHDNQRSIAHIKSITITTDNPELSLVNMPDSKIVIKGSQVFDNLISGSTTEAMPFTDLELIAHSYDHEYYWEIDTPYLFEGDSIEVDYILEKVIIDPKERPIIFLKVVFYNDDESIQKLLEIQTIKYTLKVLFENEDRSTTSYSDRIAFIVFDNENEEEFYETYWQEWVK